MCIIFHVRKKIKGKAKSLKAKQGKSAFNRPSHLVQALLMLAESLVVCVGLPIAARKHRNPLLIIPERGL